MRGSFAIFQGLAGGACHRRKAKGLDMAGIETDREEGLGGMDVLGKEIGA